MRAEVCGWVFRSGVKLRLPTTGCEQHPAVTPTVATAWPVWSCSCQAGWLQLWRSPAAPHCSVLWGRLAPAPCGSYPAVGEPHPPSVFTHGHPAWSVPCESSSLWFLFLHFRWEPLPHAASTSALSPTRVLGCPLILALSTSGDTCDLCPRQPVL